MWTHRCSGLTNQRGVNDHRNPYERDRTRVIHSPSFRRLQRKTQILSTDDGDFHRTRLTHSLEVASIGQSIVKNLFLKKDALFLPDILPSDDLINVICLLHDIGHPPFGHGGETALNYMMHEYGGFEGNGQTLRLLTKLENSYGKYGLDLTRRSLLGILKYPVCYSEVVAPILLSTKNNRKEVIRINDWLPPKAYYQTEQDEINWLLSSFSSEDRKLFQSLATPPHETYHGKSAYRSFDCSIMDIADDIAYGVHDLEDAIHLRLITREQLDNSLFRNLLNNTLLGPNLDELLANLFSLEINLRKQAIGEMVNYFLTSTKVIVTNDAFDNVLLKFNIVLSEEALLLLKYLMQQVFIHVIDSQEARTLEFGGQTVILRLFEAFVSNPMSLLDTKNRILYDQAESKASAYRIVCDYIANMTDDYAHKMHERLFGFNTPLMPQRL